MNTQVIVLAGQAPLASVPPFASAADLEWLSSHQPQQYHPFWNEQSKSPTVLDEIMVHQVHTDKKGPLTTGFGRSTHSHAQDGSLFGPELGLGWDWLVHSDKEYDQLLLLDLTTTEDNAGAVEWLSPTTSQEQQAGSAYATMISTILDTLQKSKQATALDVAGLIWMDPPEDDDLFVESWIQDVRLDVGLADLPVVVASTTAQAPSPSMDHVQFVTPPSKHVHPTKDILQEETELAQFMIRYGRAMGQGLRRAMVKPKGTKSSALSAQDHRHLQTDMRFSMLFQFSIYPENLKEEDSCSDVVEALVREAYNASTTCTDGTCLKATDVGIPVAPLNYFLLAQADELASFTTTTSLRIDLQGECDACTTENLFSIASSVVPSSFEFINQYDTAFQAISGTNCGLGLSFGLFATENMITSPCSAVQEEYTEDLTMNVTFVDNRVIDEETMRGYQISLTQLAIASYNEENELNNLRCDPNHNILGVPDWATLTAGRERQLVVKNHRGRRALKSDKSTKSDASVYYSSSEEYQGKAIEDPTTPPPPRSPKSTKDTKSTKSAKDDSRKKSTKSSDGRKPKSIKSGSSRSPSTRAPASMAPITATPTPPPTGGTVMTLSTPVPGTCNGMGCSDMSIFSDGTARRQRLLQDVNPQLACQCPVDAFYSTPPSVADFKARFDNIFSTEQFAGRFTEILKIDFV